LQLVEVFKNCTAKWHSTNTETQSTVDWDTH